MDVAQMYEDFRSQHPEMAKAADARHVAVWGSVEKVVSPLWFESLAGVLNDQMGIPEQRAEIEAVLKCLDQNYLAGSKEVKNYIDVCFVENLFYDVVPRNAVSVWEILPKNLQKLYVAFHGKPPKQR